mgnify:CR=1 FL=1
MVPASGLDSKVTAEMYALIEELNRNDGITVIMILHDITAAVQYASHLLHIGDTVFFGTKAEYLRSPQGRLFAAEKGGRCPMTAILEKLILYWTYPFVRYADVQELPQCDDLRLLPLSLYKAQQYNTRRSE